MMLFERITFLMVAGTLALFFAAFVLGVWGAVLTLYPGLGKSIVESLSGSVRQVRAAFEQGREYARTYGASFRTRFHARVPSS